MAQMTTKKASLRKIAVRKAGSVRLTAAAASFYNELCDPPVPPVIYV